MSETNARVLPSLTSSLETSAHVCLALRAGKPLGLRIRIALFHLLLLRSQLRCGRRRLIRQAGLHEGLAGSAAQGLFLRLGVAGFHLLLLRVLSLHRYRQQQDADRREHCCSFHREPPGVL